MLYRSTKICSATLVEEKLKRGPSNVDHLDKIGNLSKNSPDFGLDQQSMVSVSQCMNVDEPYKNWNDVSDNFHVGGLDHKSIEGVSQCIDDVNVNSVVKEEIVKDDVNINSLVKEDIEKDDVHKFLGKAYLSPYIQPPSTKVKCRKRRREIKLENVEKKVIKTVVGSDGVEIKLLPWKEDVTRSATAPKRTVIVPEEVNALYSDKNKMEIVSNMVSPGLQEMFKRLSHNIPLEVNDPISFALAYHERLIEFYYKYKMVPE
nr:hypothetical protein [Tanacetum cinerariifolium]